MLTVTVETSNLSLRMKMTLVITLIPSSYRSFLEKSLSIIIMKNNPQDGKLNIDYFV